MQKQPFAGILAAIVLRLNTILGRVDNSYVRVVLRPSPDWASYHAEEGIRLVVGSPSPNPTSGAGRWGLKVTRLINIYVATQNLLDPASRDEIAIDAHLTLEEAVVDAVMDGNRAITTRDGITINWVPGGAEDTRQIAESDAGMDISVLSFQVEYAVNISTGPG